MPIAHGAHPFELLRVVLRTVLPLLVTHSVGSFARISSGIGIVRCAP